MKKEYFAISYQTSLSVRAQSSAENTHLLAASVRRRVRRTDSNLDWFDRSVSRSKTQLLSP